MQNEELVFYFLLEFDKKSQKPHAFNFVCSAFISSTFLWRSSSFWNYDLFLENSETNSLPFYSSFRIIRNRHSKGGGRHKNLNFLKVHDDVEVSKKF